MGPAIARDDAEAALAAVERERLRVADEIGVPNWYWWGLALGWVAVGAASDVGIVWLTAAATLIFGAVHAAVAPRVVGGRRRSDMLSVRRELVDRRTSGFVLLAVAALALLTIAVGFAVSADGARDASIIACTFAAALILAGGPRLLGAARRRVPAR